MEMFNIRKNIQKSVSYVGHMMKKENWKPAEGEIATISALRVFYYLMSADGQITEEEKETFRQMAEEIYPANSEHLDAILKGSKMLVEQNKRREDFYDILRGGVENALNSSIPTADSFITSKLLIWDMMAIAFSDGSYDDKEKNLIQFTADILKIDHTTYLELESSIETLNDLEQEINWIKTTDRPYLTIEAMVNELADRKNVIFESVKDLITL